MLFADADWYAYASFMASLGGLIASCCTGVALLIKSVSDAMAQRTAALRVEQVRLDLNQQNQKTDQKLDAVVEKVEEVHKATNSLTDRLVESTAAEALARGGAEERKRAEERAKEGGRNRTD